LHSWGSLHETRPAFIKPFGRDVLTLTRRCPIGALPEALSRVRCGRMNTPPQGKTIAVMICEDHASLREGLRMLLEVEGDINVVGEAATGADAVARVLEQRPDVAVMDVSLVGMDGIEATRQLRAQLPSLPVLVLSASHELSTVKAAVDAGA